MCLVLCSKQKTTQEVDENFKVVWTGCYEDYSQKDKTHWPHIIGCCIKIFNKLF